MCEAGQAMRRFVLQRTVDLTGVSGVGNVAEGVVFSDGAAVLRWTSQTPSTVLYDSLEDLAAVHLHHGLTKIVWLDTE